MAKIPFDNSTPAQRGEIGQSVELGFGTDAMSAGREMSQAVQKLGKQGAGIAIDYMAKHKQSDMQTDGLNYRAKKLEIDQQAQLAASQTSNAGEIKKIYNEAGRQLDKWVTGSDDNGNPNIRWKDQVPQIRGDAKIFSTEIEAERNKRLVELSQQTDKARNEHSYDVGVQAGSVDAVKQATSNMVASGAITQEGKALLDEQGEMAIEKLHVADVIEGMQEAVRSSDQEAYDAGIDDLVKRGTWSVEQGQNQKGQFKTSVANTFLREQISSIKLENTANPNDKVFMGRLDNFRKDVAESDASGAQKSTLTAEANYAETAAISRENVKMGGIVSKTIAGVRDGKYEYSDVQQSMLNLNEKYSKLIAEGAEESLRSVAVTNDDARKATQIVDWAMSGKNAKGKDYSWEDAWSDLDNLEGNIRTMASMAIAANYVEQSATENNRINAYSSMTLRGKKVTAFQSTGNTPTALSALSFYAPDMDAKDIEKQMSAIIDWQNSGNLYPNEDGEMVYTPVDEFVKKQFSGQALDYAMKLAPPTFQSVPIGTTEGGYEFTGGNPAVSSNWKKVAE